jgi:hypothetical protein
MLFAWLALTHNWPLWLHKHPRASRCQANALGGASVPAPPSTTDLNLNAVVPLATPDQSETISATETSRNALAQMIHAYDSQRLQKKADQ